MKTCNVCKTTHESVPANARQWVEDGKLVGWFWECGCSSTMFKREMTLAEVKQMIQQDPAFHEYLSSSEPPPPEFESFEGEGWQREHEMYAPVVDAPKKKPHHLKDFQDVLQMFLSANNEQRDKLSNSFLKLKSKWTGE